MAKIRFEYSRQRALFTASVTTALSIMGIWVAARMEPGAWTTTLENVSGTALTLGVAGVAYELWLRETVTEETVALVGLEQQVTASGLRSLCPRSEHGWGDKLSSAEVLQILLMNPSGWVEREWHHVLTAARSGPAQVTLAPSAQGDSDPVPRSATWV